MSKKYISTNGDKQLAYKIDDLKEITSFATEVIIGETLEVAYKLTTVFGVMPAKLKKLYILMGKEFLYLEDGNVYDVTTTGYSKVMQVGSKPPAIAEVIKDGKTQVVIVGESACAFYDGTSLTQVYFPYAEHAVACRGKLILANANTLYVGLDYDFKTNSIALGSSVIQVPKSSGQVIGLVAFDNYVLVFCENKMYKLCADDLFLFKLQPLPFNNLSIDKNTIKELDGEVYFINNSRLCRYNGNKIEYIETMLDRNVFNLKGNAAAMKGKYLLTITSSGLMIIYVYDTITGEEAFVRNSSYFVGDGGFTTNDDTHGYYMIGKGSSNFKASWQSLALNLGKIGKKAITEIDVTLGCSATMEITGDFGSKVFLLKKGSNKKLTNLISNEFSLKITALEENFSLRDLNFKYKIIGG